jgi:hypothetical protein
MRKKGVELERGWGEKEKEWESVGQKGRTKDRRE